jgi:hypothetical protein
MTISQEEWDKLKKAESYGMFLKIYEITNLIWEDIDGIKDHNTRIMVQLENLDYELKELKKRIEKLEGKK